MSEEQDWDNYYSTIPEKDKVFADKAINYLAQIRKTVRTQLQQINARLNTLESATINFNNRLDDLEARIVALEK